MAFVSRTVNYKNFALPGMHNLSNCLGFREWTDTSLLPLIDLQTIRGKRNNVNLGAKFYGLRTTIGNFIHPTAAKQNELQAPRHPNCTKTAESQAANQEDYRSLRAFTQIAQGPQSRCSTQFPSFKN